LKFDWIPSGFDLPEKHFEHRIATLSRRLTEIANSVGTDKGTVAGQAHAYTIVYELLLADRTGSPINLMEIGMSIGGPELGFPASRIVEDTPSVRMWHEYFPRANIYGIDISDCSRFQTDWFHFYQVDCGDKYRLSEIAKCLSRSGTKFDVIMDDGSHASYHQQLTFLKFFSLLKPGGLYVIEDLDFVPLNIERVLPAVPRTREVLGQIVRYGCVVSGGAFSSLDWETVLPQVAGILVFDGAYLAELRNQFNLAAKVPLSAAAGAEPFSTLRGIARDLRSIWRGATGRKLSPRFARAKLAIIQKSP
jgi:hypothetical protein